MYFIDVSKKTLTIFLFAISSFITIIILFNRSRPTKNEINHLDPITTSTTSTYCKHVTVDELDQWFHSKQWNEIPKIIHQSWKNKSLRGRQTRWSQTWCEQYTDWRYHLWTDDENDLFVKTKFPWFYSTFQQLSPAILRVDSVRYLYLYYYGGLYVSYEIQIKNIFCFID
jgi:mannosyltransferase OCH1-like enzyme